MSCLLLAREAVTRAGCLVSLMCGLLSGCTGSSSVVFVGDGSGSVAGPNSDCRRSCEIVPPLIATPDEHSRFDGWSGGCSGFGECRPSTSSVTATFTAVDFALRVRVAGQGSVLLAEVAIGVEPLWVPRDTRTELKAVPASGWVFARWEAPCAAQPEPMSCELLVASPLEVTAIFEKAVDITVVVDGPGEVLATAPIGSCTGRCTGQYRSGTRLTLRATPRAGASFANWVNGCGDRPECSITVIEPAVVTARFNQSIQVNATGDGFGALVGLPNCETGSCSLPWSRGVTTYSFQAVPSENSRFVGFEGCPLVSDDTCTIQDFTPSVRAIFELVVANVVFGEGPGANDGRLVVSGDTEYVWLRHASGVTFGGVTADAGPPLADTKWSVFQSRGGLIRDVLRVNGSDELLSVDSQLDGGMVFLVRSGASLPGSSTDETIASLNANGAFDWVLPMPGFRSIVFNTSTDKVDGNIYFLGGLGAGATPAVFGSTSVAPPMIDGAVQFYVGALGRGGERRWSAQTFGDYGYSATIGARAFLGVLDGPVRVATLQPSTDGATCVPSWTASSSEPNALAFSFFTRQGSCASNDLTPQPAFSNAVRGEVLPAAIATGPGPGFSMIGEAISAAVTWSITPITGPFYAYRDGLNEPVVDNFTSCTDELQLSFVAEAGPTTVFLGGNGRCIPDLETVMGPRRGLVMVYDRVQQRVIRGWSVPLSRVHSMVRLNAREVRVLLSFEAPARIGAVDYPVQPFGTAQRFLVLTLRP